MITEECGNPNCRDYLLVPLACEKAPYPGAARRFWPVPAGCPHIAPMNNFIEANFCESILLRVLVSQRLDQSVNTR